MLEDIALSISTLMFVVCNIILNGFVPSVPADKNNPTKPLETYVPNNAIICSFDDLDAKTDEFAILGVWESFGHTYEFTASGKLIIDNETLHYSLEGSNVTVSGKDKDARTMKLEPMGNRTMRLNGITMYKIN